MLSCFGINNMDYLIIKSHVHDFTLLIKNERTNKCITMGHHTWEKPSAANNLIIAIFQRLNRPNSHLNGGNFKSDKRRF